MRFEHAKINLQKLIKPGPGSRPATTIIMSKYTDLKNHEAPCIGCFFAFSNEQFENGVKEKGLEGQKIYSASKLFSGLYGTD